jgi:hypothetical protein
MDFHDNFLPAFRVQKCHIITQQAVTLVVNRDRIEPIFGGMTASVLGAGHAGGAANITAAASAARWSCKKLA